MGRRNRKSATKKRQKLVIEFDERKRAYVEVVNAYCVACFIFAQIALYWKQANPENGDRNPALRMAL